MNSSKNRFTLAGVGLFTLIVWAIVFWPSGDKLTVTFLDVGEGLCAVVQSPSGRTMVVDCGTSSWRDDSKVGTSITARFLQERGVDVIDVFVLTHPHADHISGAPGLLRIKPARVVMDIGIRSRTPYYKDFIDVINESKATYRKAKRGQIIDLGGGVTAEIISPNPSYPYTDLNNHSVVMKITYGSTAFLLTGDAGEEAEGEILAQDLDISADVIQVGHHGSEDATSPHWLIKVDPEAAVISCGRNSYGHPDRDIIFRLEAAGAKIYRTDTHGAIEFSTDGSTIVARTMKDGR